MRELKVQVKIDPDVWPELATVLQAVPIHQRAQRLRVLALQGLALAQPSAAAAPRAVAAAGGDDVTRRKALFG